MKHNVDVLGIGFGPANISLAAALQETRPDLSFRFVEREADIVWQRGMLFENALDLHSNVQNIPHRDLATPRDPRSKYTFLNYLFENNRLFTHLNLDLMLPLRPEYADYIQWVASHFVDNLTTGVNATRISLADGRREFDVALSDGSLVSAKNVVIGTGRPVSIPRAFRGIESRRVFHFIEFKSRLAELVEAGARRIAVVGSSQSAAEIILYTSKVYPQLKIHGIMRRFAFPLKDTNPFMSEIYFPEFTERFYDADPHTKSLINKDVYRTNYGAADMDVIEEIYKQIYHDKLFGRNMIELKRLTEITSAKEDGQSIRIDMRDQLENMTLSENYDAVILATGFRNIGPREDDIKVPALLTGITELLRLDESEAVSVNRNYKVDLKAPTACNIFLNGLCESTHGMGDAGSLSLVSIRAQKILSEIGVGNRAGELQNSPRATQAAVAET